MTNYTDEQLSMNILPQDQRDSRRRVSLSEFHFPDAVVDGVTVFLKRNLPSQFTPVSRVVLGSEPFVLSWLPLIAEIPAKGVKGVLEEALFEFTFPIKEGVSKSAAHQALSLPGWGTGIPKRDPAHGGGPIWEAPDKWRLGLCDTVGGLLPVVETASRRDFVSMVQAILHRNEPTAVPDAVGSFLVMNYANRRVYGQVRELIGKGFLNPESRDPRLWTEKFLLLSSGNYSGVEASEMGFTADEWLQVSRQIRLEHEGCHYLVRRLFPRLPFGFQDEVVADFAGLMGSLGKYKAASFLRFMGIDGNGNANSTGRAGFYMAGVADRPDVKHAVGVMLNAAAKNLEAAFSGWSLAQWQQQRHLVIAALTWMSFEEMAAPDFPETYTKLIATYLNE